MNNSKAENMRKYRAANPEKYREQSRMAKVRLRQKLFDIYGHKCAICGFSDETALVLDHILNNGACERRQLGERGVYRRAVMPEHRNEYRIVCWNCNIIERKKCGIQNQNKPAVAARAWETINGGGAT